MLALNPLSLITRHVLNVHLTSVTLAFNPLSLNACGVRILYHSWIMPGQVCQIGTWTKDVRKLGIRTNDLFPIWSCQESAMIGILLNSRHSSPLDSKDGFLFQFYTTLFNYTRLSLDTDRWENQLSPQFNVSGNSPFFWHFASRSHLFPNT